MAAKKMKIPKVSDSMIEKVLFKKEWVIDPVHLMVFQEKWARNAYGVMLKHRAEMAKHEAGMKQAESKMCSELAKSLRGVR